jgi:hypothetical protein
VNIGEPKEIVEVSPLPRHTVPDFVPDTMPDPVPVPERAPVEEPAEPEKVPA